MVVAGALPDRPAAVAERRAREVGGPARRAGELRRGQEAPLRLLDAARAGERVAGRRQQREALAPVGGAQPVERVEREAVEAGGLLGGVRLERAGGSLAGGGERLGVVARGAGVLRELGHPRRVGRAGEPLERRRGLRVQAHPARARDAVVERVAEQHVLEAQALGRARDVREQPGGDRLVEPREQRLVLAGGERREQVAGKLPPEHRREHEQLAALRREVGDPPCDDVAQARRHRETLRGRSALDRQQPHELADEQRVALRPLVQRGGEPRRRQLGGGAIQVLDDVARAEPAQHEPSACGLARDFGEHLGQRLPGPRIRVPVGGEQQQAARSELAREEAQEQQRGGVGGVQVVERDHERPCLARPPEELGGRVEEAEADELGLERRRRRQTGEAVGELRHDLGQVGGARAGLLGQRRGLAGAHVGPQRLDPRPVRGRAAGLPAAPDQGRRAAGARVPRQLLRQAALADPGLARQQEQAPAAGEGVLDAGVELRQLPFAPDEHARRRRFAAPLPDRRLERGVLGEDRLVQLAQPRARLDAELADQRAARGAVGLERVRLAPGPVEGDQELTAQALAQRVLADERLELGDELRTAAEREVGVDAVLERHEPQLLQAPDLGLAERLVGEIGERAPAPERERLAQRARRRVGVAGRARGRQQALEPVQVEPVLRDPQLVARRAGHEDAVAVAGRGRLEHPPEPRDRHREGLQRVAPPRAGPELLDQPFAGHRLAGVQQQQRQQRPLLDAPDGELPAADPRLERPQDAEFHWGPAPNVTADIPRRQAVAAPLTRRCRPAGW